MGCIKKFTQIGILIYCISMFCIFVHTESFIAPQVQGSAAGLLPERMDDFGTGLLSMLRGLFPEIKKELAAAAKIGLSVYSCVLLVSVLKNADVGASPAELAGVVCISISVIKTSQSMIRKASETVAGITEYSKLFLPVVTAAAAAQGEISSASALYVGTAVFTTFLSNAITTVVLPCVYFYLTTAIADAILGEHILNQLKNHIKQFSVWLLKITLILFTSYMTITGAISGTADKAALSVAKSAISTMVPVIGSSLSSAADTLLISVKLAKNAIGIYGVFAFLAISLTPFLHIGVHYLILKATAVLCALPNSKKLCMLVNDFSSAMGMLLGMIGSITVLSIISAVCFLKGIL